MTIKLYQDKNKLNKRGKAPLKFSVCYGKQYWLPAFESVKPEAFRNGKVNSKEEFALEINRSISYRRRVIELIIREAEEKRISVTSNYLRSEYKSRVQSQDTESVSQNGKAHDIQSFWDCWDDYLRVNKQKFSKEHTRKFDQIRGHLLIFCQTLDFQDFDESFYDDYFFGYLIEERQLTNNTVSKHIKCLKGVLTHAWTLGLLEKPIHGSFKDISIKTERIYLDWEEVEGFEKVDSIYPVDRLVKDLFLLGCYTGLRWQDLNHLEAHNFKKIGNQYYLSIHSYKGKKNLSNPLTDKALAICRRYKFDLPKVTNQQCNESLKRLARSAKINSPTERVRYCGQERMIEIHEKWRLVTMHIARHTFACEFLKRNKSHGLSALKALSEILGHGSTKTTEIYWNMISAEKDKMLLNSF